MSKSVIIIPTYNEEENIKRVISLVREYCPDYHIVFVDGASNDGTVGIIRGFLEDNSIHLIEQSKKMGLASAYIQGFKWALENQFCYICQLDADLSHNPSYIKDMAKLLGRGYDFIVGSRYIKGGGTEGWSRLRSMLSACGSLYSRIILRCGIKDMTGGFNMWRMDVLESLNWDRIISKGYFFQIEIKMRSICNGFKCIEIPIIFKERSFGYSKMSIKITLEALFKVWQLKRIIS